MVNEVEWAGLQQDLEAARSQFLASLKSLGEAQFLEEGAGMGTVVHAAYHLGAIRQLMHQV